MVESLYKKDYFSTFQLVIFYYFIICKNSQLLAKIGGIKMTASNIDQRNKSIATLLNGTNLALKSVVPVDYTMSKPKLLNDLLYVQYGVFVGITGDIKGKLVLIGEENLFSTLGEVMFGMPLQDEMLMSFSGELGNMIAGNLSTHIVKEGVTIDITAPSIITGEAKISGHDVAIQVVSSFKEIGDLHINLLLDE